MLGSASSRLLATGGGAAFVQQVLTWLLLWTVALGALHVFLGLLKGRLPTALFCLLGGLASVGTGLFAMSEMLVENSRRSTWTASLWWPGFTLGLFVVGALGAAAWAVITLGLSRALGRAPGAPDA